MKTDRSEFKYLVANDRDRLWGIVATSVGFQCVRAGEAYPPAGHPEGYCFNVSVGRVLDEYQLIYVVDGEGVFESGGRRYRLTPGMMFIIFPGHWHTFRPSPDMGWTVYWIGFKGHVVDSRLNNGFFNERMPVYDVGISSFAIDIFRNAMQTASLAGPNYQQVLAGAVSLLTGIALNVSRTYSSNETEARDRIARAKVMMREGLSENLSAQKISERLHVSYSWFRSAFRRQTGMAPSQYILELKLFRAMELLSDPVMTIKEIAYALDFSSARYFSGFFRKRMGCSPQEYRNRVYKGVVG
ncbi:MAG TPA: AraC family transcriptional regulator [Candidatus Alistipes merdigallinarum]|nr:AraC family transcriptional regulator [Candidatus Alistipes merdigallinarum]